MKVVNLILLCALLSSCGPSPAQQTATAVAGKEEVLVASPTKTRTEIPTGTAPPIPTATRTTTPEPTASPIATPTSVRTVPPGWILFQGEGLELIHPETWLQQSPQPNPFGGVTFLFLIREADGTNINFTRGTLGDFPGMETPEAIEQALWDAQLSIYDMLDLKDQVEVESHSAIDVGGLPAVIRVFHAPGLLDPSRIYFKIIVVVVHGEDVYQIVVTATNANALGDPEIMEILLSVQFEPQ
ncbi:MAG: hypothetical protein GTO14_04730 [Anaerolineales bacterium]|nr:hypothetical protein [Anaerolineales bacterium]